MAVLFVNMTNVTLYEFATLRSNFRKAIVRFNIFYGSIQISICFFGAGTFPK